MNGEGWQRVGQGPARTRAATRGTAWDDARPNTFAMLRDDNDDDDNDDDVDNDHNDNDNDHNNDSGANNDHNNDNMEVCPERILQTLQSIKF